MEPAQAQEGGLEQPGQQNEQQPLGPARGHGWHPCKRKDSTTSMTMLMTAFAAMNPVERYLRFLLADDPFRGLYNLNAFDLLLLLPYFAILLTLSFYGLHRYRMVYLYKRYRHRRPPGLPASPAPASWPPVTIQLPPSNEKNLVGSPGGG